jgi:predicted nucleic acid-binding protein
MIVDASVVVKWFVSEIGWEDALALARAELAVSAPDYLFVETGRGLLRHHRNGTLSLERVKAAFAGVRTLVTLLPLDDLIEPAFEIATSSSVTIYDALYVAAAVDLDCALVTADRRLVAGLAGTRWAGRTVLLRDWASQFENPSRR